MTGIKTTPLYSLTSIPPYLFSQKNSNKWPISKKSCNRMSLRYKLRIKSLMQMPLIIIIGAMMKMKRNIMTKIMILMKMKILMKKKSRKRKRKRSRRRRRKQINLKWILTSFK